jgi:hypothetical protein
VCSHALIVCDLKNYKFEKLQRITSSPLKVPSLDKGHTPIENKHLKMQANESLPNR